jgi:hypothetical protein
MLEFIIGHEAQTLPYWLINAIDNGTVSVEGTSASEERYYTVGGVTAGPGDRLVFDGSTITVKG